MSATTLTRRPPGLAVRASSLAEGALVVVVGAHEPTARLRDGLAGTPVRLHVVHDELLALARAAHESTKAVVLSSEAGLAEPSRLVELLRREIGVPVLLALGDDLGPAAPVIFAGAVPALGLPLHANEVMRALTGVWPRHEPIRLQVVGGLLLDEAGCTVEFAGRRTDLTALECALLAVLLKDAGRVVPRERLRALWPSLRDPDGTLVAAVTRLRRRLASVGLGESLHTVRGLGYRFDPPGGGGPA